MAKSAKLRAAKLRSNRKLVAEQEAQKLLNRAHALKTMVAGFARTKRTKKEEEQFQRNKIPSYLTHKYKVTYNRSLEERFPISQPQQRQVLVGDMLIREEKAKEKFKQMQARIAPVGNKMGDQFLSESEFIALQKGELRRR